MLGFLSRHKGLVVVGALLILPAVLLFAQTRKGGGRGPVIGALLDVSGVVQRGLLWATGGLNDLLEHYVTSVASYQELVDLRRERAARGRLDTRLEELSIENEKLRALAAAAAVVDGPRPLGARVIGRSGQPLARLFTIDRGRRHGLRRGDGVIAADGVVGVVLAVGYATSDVLLLTDPTSAIDIVVQRSRARGMIRGRGDDDKYAAIVEDFDRLRDVEPGDALVTSGIGSRFPVGMLVGIVVDVDDRDDLTLAALIRPAVDFATLEHVSVLVGRELPTAPPLGVMDDEVKERPRRPIRRKKKAAAVTPSAPVDGATLATTDTSDVGGIDADIDAETEPETGTDVEGEVEGEVEGDEDIDIPDAGVAVRRDAGQNGVDAGPKRKPPVDAGPPSRPDAGTTPRRPGVDARPSAPDGGGKGKPKPPAAVDAGVPAKPVTPKAPKAVDAGVSP